MTNTNIDKFHIVKDESKLELPAYIDQPEYGRNKSVGYSLQIVGWFAFMWLFMPLLTVFFWILAMLTTVVALPKTIFKTQKRARWVSPDRGFRGEMKND